jgi:flagellar biogenesis protein FliO
MLVKGGARVISGSHRLTQCGGLAGWILSRLRSAYRAQVSMQKEMRLVETLSLGGRRQLMLVECCGNHFLIGCGTDNVGTIAQIAISPGSGYVENEGEGQS